MRLSLLLPGRGLLAPSFPLASLSPRGRLPAVHPPHLRPARPMVAVTDCARDPSWLAERKARSLERAAGITPLLGGLRVVIVSPKFEANVGAVARACDCFEVGSMVIVSPRCDPFSDEAFMVACGSHVLSNARVCEDLSEALEDCVGAIGFTRRTGNAREVHDGLGRLLAGHPQLMEHGETSCALVFGREEHGLYDEELALCGLACSIPSGRTQPSLNLSAAVNVALAQWFEEARKRQVAAAPDSGNGEHVNRAAQGEISSLVERVAALAQRAGLSPEERDGGNNHGRRKRVAGHLRAVLSRAGATTQEVRAGHGLCKALEGLLNDK